ncbi:MAG: PAS domain-containing protein [Desulfuromonadales bacterium]|nr:PAS domain-containing protein [Desulfuromonadales bacterium]
MPQMPLAIFQTLITTLAEGVIFLDADHIVRLCNPAAERLRRVPADAAIGRSFFDLCPSSAQREIRELLAGLREAKIVTGRRLVRTPKRWLEETYSPVLGEDDAYLGTLLISRDFTEQWRLSTENQKLRLSLTPAGRPRPAGPPFIPGRSLKEALGEFEREYIDQALRFHGRKKVETAEALGISRKCLWEKLQRNAANLAIPDLD